MTIEGIRPAVVRRIVLVVAFGPLLLLTFAYLVASVAWHVAKEVPETFMTAWKGKR